MHCTALFVIQSMLCSVNKQFRGSAFEVIELRLRKCRADLYAQHPLSDTRLEVVRALAQEVKGVTERLVIQLPHPFFTYSRPTHINIYENYVNITICQVFSE